MSANQIYGITTPIDQYDMDKSILSTRDFILYLLNKIELAKVGKIRLNKLAFFVEFGYLFKTGKPLSKTQYAGIDLGPAINNYRDILAKMVKDGDIKIQGNRIVPLRLSSQLPPSITSIIDPLIKRFDLQPDSMLVSLSHATDAYKITTDNETKMGRIINKNLASLETALFDEDVMTDEIAKLPMVDKTRLVPYEFG